MSHNDSTDDVGKKEPNTGASTVEAAAALDAKKMPQELEEQPDLIGKNVTVDVVGPDEQPFFGKLLEFPYSCEGWVTIETEEGAIVKINAEYITYIAEEKPDTNIAKEGGG